MDEHVKIVDVTLRDGLQDQGTVIETDNKVQVAHLLAEAGFPALEVTSFVRPDWVPQLADATDLLARLEGSGIVRHALVPNRRGLDRALQTSVEVVTFVVSASTAHNQHNLNRTTEQSLGEIGHMTRRALDAGRAVHAGIATSFGCPFQGVVTTEEVLRVLDAYLQAGVQHVNLADTIGVATPETFAPVLERAIEYAGGPEHLGIHLHDRGTGVHALIEIALDLGIRSFEAAIGGLGGCPFAPGAPGNARVERLLPQIEGRGFHTGINASALPPIALTLGLALGRGEPAPIRITAAS